MDQKSTSQKKKKIRKKNEDEKEYKPVADDYEEEDLKTFKQAEASESLLTRTSRRRNNSPNDNAKTFSLTPSSSIEALPTKPAEQERIVTEHTIKTAQETVIVHTKRNYVTRHKIIIIGSIFIGIALFGLVYTKVSWTNWIEGSDIDNIARTLQVNGHSTEQSVENLIQIMTLLLKNRMGRHKCYLEESYLESTESMKTRLQQMNLTNFDHVWELTLNRILEGNTNIKHFKHYLYVDTGIIPFSCVIRETASKLKLLLFLCLTTIPVVLYSIRRSKQSKHDEDILRGISNDIAKMLESQKTKHSRKEVSEPFVIAQQAIELLKPLVAKKSADFWQKVVSQVEQNSQVQATNRSINGVDVKTWEWNTIQSQKIK